MKPTGRANSSTMLHAWGKRVSMGNYALPRNVTDVLQYMRKKDTMQCNMPWQSIAQYQDYAYHTAVNTIEDNTTQIWIMCFAYVYCYTIE